MSNFGSSILTSGVRGDIHSASIKEAARRGGRAKRVTERVDDLRDGRNARGGRECWLRESQERPKMPNPATRVEICLSVARSSVYFSHQPFDWRFRICVFLLRHLALYRVLLYIFVCSTAMKSGYVFLPRDPKKEPNAKVRAQHTSRSEIYFKGFEKDLQQLAVGNGEMRRS